MAQHVTPSPAHPIWVVVGTRPEAIKQAPLFLELSKRFGAPSVKLVSTGQHRSILDQALLVFSLKPDIDLEIMTPNQSLTGSAALILEKADQCFKEREAQAELPSLVIVQGDTTTAAMMALAAFHRQIAVAHNEAGLRSYDLLNPFPEEANRKMISALADWHFAPTHKSRDALVREAVATDKIFVTGNTGIDAYQFCRSLPCPDEIKKPLAFFKDKKLRPVLVTAHRRENQDLFEVWFKQLEHFLNARPEFGMLYPLHPNNRAKKAAEELSAKSAGRFQVTDPLSYGSVCHFLDACAFVITDSGGIQEEAATLGMPVVICRRTTERMEAVESGHARLVQDMSKDFADILNWAATKSLGPRDATNLYGDGKASEKIASILAQARS